mgnify:CR=1 FL=1|jgi:hypothetical protein
MIGLASHKAQIMHCLHIQGAEPVADCQWLGEPRAIRGKGTGGGDGSQKFTSG